MLDDDYNDKLQLSAFQSLKNINFNNVVLKPNASKALNCFERVTVIRPLMRARTRGRTGAVELRPHFLSGTSASLIAVKAIRGPVSPCLS